MSSNDFGRLKVYARPSAIVINHYRKRQCYALEKMLAVWDMAQNRYTQFLYEFEAEDDKIDPNYGILKVPRGLGVDTVLSALDGAGLEYDFVDQTNDYKYYRGINIEMQLPPKNQIQEDSVKFLKDTLYHDHQAFLALDVGMGKTYCATYHVAESRKATLIVSYNLAYQWETRMQEYSTLVSGDERGGLVNIVGAQYFENCVAGKIKPTAAVYLTTIGTLHSYQKLHGKGSLQDIVKALGIGIKVFDEAHNRYLQFNSIDLNMQTDETIYLSATPGRSVKTEDRMFSKIYKGVPAYGSYTAQYNDFYVIKYITFDSRSTVEDRASFKTPRGLNSLKYMRYLFDKWGDTILDMVMLYAEPILKENPDGKLLIVTDWVKDIAHIKEWLNQKHPEYSVGTYCQLVQKKEDKEKELNNRIIVGTIGSMQNGKDIANLQIIFPLTMFSSSIVTRQLLGRLRPLKDKNVYYFDIADLSVSSIMQQRRERDSVLRARAMGGNIENDRIDLDRIGGISPDWESDSFIYYKKAS